MLVEDREKSDEVLNCRFTETLINEQVANGNSSLRNQLEITEKSQQLIA